MSRFLLTLALIAAAPMALAAPAPTPLPKDVPARHWAAGSVGRVTHEKIMGRDVDGRFRGDKPVTRYELAVTLDRFVRYVEAARKPLHPAEKPVPVSVPARATQAEGAALTHLVSQGFLPADSPLLKKDGHQPVTATELSDALAAVTIRLSDRAEPPHTY